MKESAEHRKRLGRWFDPAKESLWSKHDNLDETLRLLEETKLSSADQKVLQRCRENLGYAQACFDKTWWGIHHHLAWEYMHRVDEDLMLLFPLEELYPRAVSVKTYFDLNISEKKTREEWLGKEGGGKGKLLKALDSIEGLKSGEAVDERDRYVIKQVLSIVNHEVDRTFWALSMNTRTTVVSGIILGILMVVFWLSCFTSRLPVLGSSPTMLDYVMLALLGVMGGYLSNVMTKEGFLYVRGGPFFIHVAYHLAAKPLLSAFAAVFIFVVEQSRLIFSLSGVPDAAKGIIALNVAPGAPTGYAYALLALVSGFASDKLLRDMIDGFLRKLERKAEKSKETKQGK